MPQINLTPQETLMLTGFIAGVLEIVEEKSEMELVNKENTTAQLKSVMSKLEVLLEINSQETITGVLTAPAAVELQTEDTTKMVSEEKYV
jgi:hypothetical protein